MNTRPRSRLFGPSRPFHPFGRGLLMLLSALLLTLPVPALAAPGDLDPSFDGDGSALTDFGGSEAAKALVVQSDGKLVAAGDRVVGNNGVFDRDIALARYNSDGSLDTSFGAAGKVVVTDLESDRLSPVIALVVQPDGKLVVGSGRRPGPLGGRGDFILARFHPDGSLDTNFGAGELVVVPQGSELSGLVLQPDGKLAWISTDKGLPNVSRGVDARWGR